jgi:hypothetical protein
MVEADIQPAISRCTSDPSASIPEQLNRHRRNRQQGGDQDCSGVAHCKSDEQDVVDSNQEWLGCTGCWAQLDASRTTLVIATIKDLKAVRAARGS